MTTIDINFDYSKVRGSTELHNKLKKEFMIMVSRKFPELIIIPYDVGFHRAWSNPEVPVRVGQEGVPDLIVFINNTYIMFDAKTGKNKFQANQDHFAGRLFELTGEKKVYKLSVISDGLDIIENNR